MNQDTAKQLPDDLAAAIDRLESDYGGKIGLLSARLEAAKCRNLKHSLGGLAIDREELQRRKEELSKRPASPTRDASIAATVRAIARVEQNIATTEANVRRLTPSARKLAADIEAVAGPIDAQLIAATWEMEESASV